METTTPTAREQFVNDYILVVDNSHTPYFQHLQIAKSGRVAEMSDKLREDFEDMISQIAEMAREKGYSVGADLIAQMLIGFGSDTFDDIARHYIDAVKEGK